MMRCYDSAYMERSVVVSQHGAGFVWRLPGCFQAGPSGKPHDSWTHQRPGNKDRQDTLFTERQLFKETHSLTLWLLQKFFVRVVKSTHHTHIPSLPLID